MQNHKILIINNLRQYFIFTISYFILMVQNKTNSLSIYQPKVVSKLEQIKNND
jgi:hypothetical protein